MLRVQRFLGIGVPLWLGIGLFAISLKFSTYLDHQVTFPIVPNAFDLLFVMGAAVYLLSRAYRIWRRP